MNSLNSILLEGNLVKDPMMKSTSKGTQICTLRLAANRYYKSDNQSPNYEKETSFFDVETWAKLAEACYSKGKKGRGLRVVGRLKQNRWNDPEGKPQSRITIVADHVEFHSESKKEKPSVSSDSYDDDYMAGAVGDPVSMMKERELEEVVF